MLTVPPSRYTLAPYRGARDADTVRVWYHTDAESDTRFRAWSDARRAVEIRARIRASLERRRDSIIEGLAGRTPSGPVRDELDKLEADIAAAPVVDLGDMWAEYAKALTGIVRSVEVRTHRIPWPTDPGDAVAILRDLGPHLVGDLLLAVYRGAYDEDLVGKP